MSLNQDQQNDSTAMGVSNSGLTSSSDSKTRFFSVHTFSKVTWSLISNAGNLQILRKRTIRALAFLEGFFCLFYALLMLSKLRYTLGTNQIYDALGKTPSDSLEQVEKAKNLPEGALTLQLSLDFMHDYLLLWQGDAQIYIPFINAIVLVINLIIVASILLLLKQNQEHHTNQTTGHRSAPTRHKQQYHFGIMSDKSTFKGFLCAAIVVISRVLYIPAIEILISSFYVDIAGYYNLGIAGKIIIQLLNSLSLVLLLIVVFYGKRILSLNMFSDDFAPWSITCASNIFYLEVLVKIIAPALLSIDPQGASLNVEIICILILQIIYLISIVVFTTTLDSTDTLIQLIFESTVTLIYEIATVNYIMKNYLGKEGFFIIVLIPFQCYALYYYNTWRYGVILNKLKKNGSQGIKHEIEAEKIVLKLISYAEKLINTLDISEAVHFQEFQELSMQLKTHQNRCVRSKNAYICVCADLHEYVRLLRESMRQRGSGDHISLTVQKLEEAFEVLHTELKDSKQYISCLQCFARTDTAQQERAKLLASTRTRHENQLEQLSQTVNLSIAAVRRRLYSSILDVLSDELREKFPQSLKLYFAKCYIQASVVRRPFHCLNTMRAQPIAALSTLDRISKQINDYYILARLGFIDGVPVFGQESPLFSNWTDSSSIPSNNSVMDNKQLSIEHFITLDQAMRNLNKYIETLRLGAIDFWTIFSSKHFSPDQALELSYKLADDIQSVHIQYTDLEEMMVKKDPMVYMKFACCQRDILNDFHSYVLLMTKIRSILDMRKISNINRQRDEFNHSASIVDEDTAFMIVDASPLRMGTIIMMNEACRALLKQSASARNMKINAMMPRIIAEEHNSYIRRFSLYGESSIINQCTVQMVANRHGCIFPAHLLVKMHYSQRHKHCFFGSLSPLEAMTPFRNGLSYPVKQLAFISMNMHDGRIYEFSESFINLLIQGGARCQMLQQSDVRDQLVEVKKLCIDELVINFNFQEYLYKREENRLQGMPDTAFFYEDSFFIDLNCVCGTAMYGPDLQNIKVRVSIRCETINRGQTDIGYVILIVEDPRFDINLGKTAKNKSNSKGSVNGIVVSDQIENSQDATDTAGTPFGHTKTGSSVSGSDSAVSQQQQNNLSLMSYLSAQLNGGFKYPRSLRIVMQLVVFLFIVSMSIASVNLALNVDNKNKGVATVLALRKSLNRMNLTSASRMLLRSMLNIANGYESRSTSMLSDRFDTYYKLLARTIDGIKASQNALDISKDYKASDEIKRQSAAKIMRLEQINSEGIKSFQMATMSQSQQLQTTKLLAINTGKPEDLVGNLNLQTLTPAKEGYHPTQNEQYIYFTVINGNGVIREYNWVMMIQYLVDADLTSQNYDRLTLITSLVSILSILCVLIIISPIISRTEERRYLALTFFLQISEQQRHEFIENCKNFKLTNSGGGDGSNAEKLKDMMRSVEMSYSQSVYSNDSFKDREQVLNQIMDQGEEEEIKNNNDISYQDVTQSDSLVSLRYNLEQNSFRQLAQDFTNQRIRKTQNKQNIILSKKISQGKQNEKRAANLNKVVTGAFQKGSVRFKGNHESMNGINEEHEPQSLQQQNFERGQANGEENNEAINLGDIKINVKKKIKGILDNTVEGEVVAEESEPSKEAQAIEAIAKQAHRQKYKTLISLMALMSIFAGYFIGSYFMAIENYYVTATSVNDLNVIQFKKLCFENLLVLLRENQIRNESVLLTEDNKTVATVGLIKQCQGRETQYLHLRQNLPSYLKEAGNVIKDLESNDFCKIIYNEPGESEIREHCENILNGLLTMGLSNAFSYFYRQTSKLQRRFDSENLAPGGRSLKYLTEVLKDPEIVTMIDIELYLMDKPFEILKNKCQESTIDYFTAIMSQIFIIFAIYVSFLAFCFLAFFFMVFKRLRDTMFNSNLLLRIIPYHSIFDKETQLRLQNFFVN